MSGEESPSRSSVRPYLALFGFAALPPIVFGLLSTVASKDTSSEHCSGFAPCLSMSDRANVLAVLLIPVMMVWAVGGMVALTRLRRRPRYRARPAVVQGLIPMVPAYVLVLFLILLV